MLTSSVSSPQFNPSSDVIDSASPSSLVLEESSGKLHSQSANELICLEDSSTVISQADFGMTLMDKLDSFTLDDLDDDDFNPRAAEDVASTSTPVAGAKPVLTLVPALPPRDMKKSPIQENNNNPFMATEMSSASDPFGMDSFAIKPVSTPAIAKPVDPLFSFEELDPLRN
jgi:hypothetical protein